jgi:hypothetical protein
VIGEEKGCLEYSPVKLMKLCFAILDLNMCWLVEVGRFLAIMKIDKLNMDVPSSADFYL